MKMIFRNGERSDSMELTKIQVEYLKEDWGTLTEEQEMATRKQLPDYMERRSEGNLTTYVAGENGRLAGTVLMMVVEKLVGPSAINGKTGTLMNAYARPEYRKLGLGTKLVTMALEDAWRKELCHVDLHATVQGKKLYEYFGFQKSESHYTPMVLELQEEHIRCCVEERRLPPPVCFRDSSARLFAALIKVMTDG